VDHHGNTVVEDYLPEGFAFGWERPRDLSLLLDHLVETGAADPDRTGAAGFSLGGYTVAALLGARVDADVMLAVLTGAAPAPDLPELPDLVTRLRERYDDDELARRVAAGSGSVADPRVRAGFVLAPALGALVTAESLASVSAPLELRWGDADVVCPPESDAHVYLEGVPRARGRSVGPEVGHYVFLADTDDPTGVREQVGDEAVSFFQEMLGHP
jgi:predicted dienelactone hydrolase